MAGRGADLQISANSSRMTVLVSVKINDGVVMAADSASSFESGMVYQNADKIVNLMEGLPIGAMATGAGGIGNESIDTLMKDLRRRFSGEDAKHPDWALDPATYTLRDVAIRLRSFLFEEKVKAYSCRTLARLELGSVPESPAPGAGPPKLPRAVYRRSSRKCAPGSTRCPSDGTANTKR